jgi:hypothetical protein
MSRKRCIRKVWPKVNTIALAISGASITTEADLDKLRLRELSAIESFSKGTATPHEFRDLCDMLNLAETMGRMGIGPEVLPACENLERWLLVAKENYEASGRMGFGPNGSEAARDVYEYHDLQRQSVDRSTYERAITTTRNRIRSAHPSVKVLA